MIGLKHPGATKHHKIWGSKHPWHGDGGRHKISRSSRSPDTFETGFLQTASSGVNNPDSNNELCFFPEIESERNANPGLHKASSVSVRAPRPDSGLAAATAPSSRNKEKKPSADCQSLVRRPPPPRGETRPAVSDSEDRNRLFQLAMYEVCKSEDLATLSLLLSTSY